MLRKLRSRLRKKRGQLHLDIGDYRKTVFLAGTGRSGTTWVENIINCDGSYRVMFEPFHSKKIPILKEWNYRQYLRRENRDKRFLEPATIILNGRIRNEWIDQFNTTFLVRKRLIKDIRANLFLRWIKQNFPEIPIILILRHPCAVANSKLKLGWDTHLNDFLMQEDIIVDYLRPFKDAIEAAANMDMFDKHIFMWCIENYIPLKQFNQGEIFVVFYENLCRNPQKEINDITSFIGVQFSTRALEVAAIPSSLSRKDSVIFSGTNLIDAWRNDINEKQISRAVAILQIFGMQTLYGEGNVPLVNGKDAMKALVA